VQANGRKILANGRYLTVSQQQGFCHAHEPLGPVVFNLTRLVSAVCLFSNLYHSLYALETTNMDKFPAICRKISRP